MRKQYLLSVPLLLVFGGLVFTQCEKSDTLSPYLVNLSTSTTLGSYLTDNTGSTLYFFAMDSNGANNCTGGCTTNWPVFSVTGLTADKLAPGLVLTDFNTVSTPNGMQVTYKGWPLYYYAPGGVREAANTTTGDGNNGLWFVAKPDYTIMIAKQQLIGSDTKNYVVSATNVYSEGVGASVYFTDLVGRTLYSYYKDSSNVNKYTKADLTNNGTWPIYETDKIVVPSILDKSLFGSITAVGKKQLTYKGWPMYYFGADADATTGAFRGSTKGVSFPKPNIWPAFMKDVPAAPKKL
jgi:predicted lipoprotein with Yx(FWY)xxD motif